MSEVYQKNTKELFTKLDKIDEKFNNKIELSEKYFNFIDYLFDIIKKYQMLMNDYYIIHEIINDSSISRKEIEILSKICNNELFLQYLIFLFDKKTECEKKLDIINNIINNNINVNTNNIIYEYISNLFIIIENSVISLNNLFLEKIKLYNENNIDLENKHINLDILIKKEINNFYECDNLIMFYKNNFLVKIHVKI